MKRAEQVVEAGPPDLPVLRRPDRPRRPPLRAGQRLPPPGPVGTPVAPTGALLEDELVLHGRIMPASNATFLGEIGGVRVVYKPIAGERPLWDFPDGTLAGPGGGGVPRLGGASAGTSCRRPGCATARTAPAWCSSGRSPTPSRRPSTWCPRARSRPAGSTSSTASTARTGRSRWSTRTPPRCAGWRSSTWSSTTPTARAATSWRWPTGTGTASTTASPSTPSPSSAPCCGAGPGEPLTNEEVRRAGRAPRRGRRRRSASALAQHLTEPRDRRAGPARARLADHGVLPAPRGDYPAIPWPPF